MRVYARITRAWLPRLCMRCGWFMWLNRVKAVECGPNTENVYHLSCMRKSYREGESCRQTYQQEAAWGREKSDPGWTQNL